jgi:GNAT superfamily N-acetyltransferase
VTALLEIKSFVGSEITPFLESLAKLRIEVFRDFPYLYEGNLEYEKNYLEIYLKSSRSVLVAVFDRGILVGAATALPLIDETDYVQKPFIEMNYNLNEIYYFGESLLQKSYRGRGIGHQFFEGREQKAKDFHFKMTVFCAVKRAENHSLRPKNYQALDPFWIKRGYQKNESLISEFSWQDLGDTFETKKQMNFWTKNL